MLIATAFRRLRGIAIPLGLILVLAPVAEAGTATGTVVNLIIRDTDGLVYVYLSAAPTGRPPCAASTSYFMVAAENTDSGKRLYALLLSAKVTGQTVQVNGANTCTRWADGEDIASVIFQ